MCDYQPAKILQELATKLEATRPIAVEPLTCNRWLAVSTLQKSIRRGDTTLAMRAAATMWNLDRQAFWRRLPIVALEDVGVANPGLVTQVLTATSSWMFRREVGDLRVALYLVHQLATSVKCRLADETYILAERGMQYADLRKLLAIADGDSLREVACNDAHDMIERLIGLWNIAGTKRFPSEILPARTGELMDAVETLRGLPLPLDFVESCVSVSTRSPYPLSIFAPILLQAATQHHRSEILVRNLIPPTLTVETVPVYAADMFTRVGQESFRLLRRAVPELKPFSVRQIGLGVFYREGALVDKLLCSPWLDQYRQAGEAADIEGAGLCIASYMSLREELERHSETLTEIRLECLSKHMSSEAA